MYERTVVSEHTNNFLLVLFIPMKESLFLNCFDVDTPSYQQPVGRNDILIV